MELKQNLVLSVSSRTRLIIRLYIMIQNLRKAWSQVLRAMNDPDIKDVIEFPKFSGSEDFSYYAAKFPGTFFYIGCKPKGVEKAYFNHHPKFDIDEDALLVAAKAVGQVVCSYYDLD